MPRAIITLTSDHAAEWLALRREGVRLFPQGFLITPEEAEAMSEERAAEILGFGGLRGILHNSKLIGFCGYRRQIFARMRHRAEIGPFYVTPDHQGSGAAGALMSAIIEEAMAEGVEVLELFVDSENERAIRFYERAGFDRIASHPDNVRIDGKPRTDHFYQLRLPR